MYIIENRKRIIQSYIPYRILGNSPSASKLEKRVRTEDACNDLKVACRILNMDSEGEILLAKDCIERHGFLDWDSYMAIKKNGYME